MRGDPIAVVLRQVRHALFLRQVLAKEPVGVFIGAAFPRMVRRREVEAGAGALLDRGVAVELGPVVRRDRPHGTRLAVNQLRRALVHVRRGAGPGPPEITFRQTAWPDSDWASAMSSLIQTPCVCLDICTGLNDDQVP